MTNIKLSTVIVAGNEEDTIVDCLKSILFSDEIILVQNPTTTAKTILKAKQIVPDIKIVIYNQPEINFAAWHDLGSTNASGVWQLHIDCDERVTPKLQSEILEIINSEHHPYSNYDIPRANYFLNHRVKYGGTYPDYVKRLYLTENFSGYVNSIHEQPRLSGNSSVLKNDLIHLTHRNLSSMLFKSLNWTSIEAGMIHRSGHPPIVGWRIIRMMLTKFYERLIQQQMWRDGTVGWISAIFEIFDTYIIYAQLWVLQKHEA